MKFRIKQIRNGKYKVQRFTLFFWESAYCDWTGKFDSEFDTLEGAKKAMEKSMSNFQSVKPKVIIEAEKI